MRTSHHGLEVDTGKKAKGPAEVPGPSRRGGCSSPGRTEFCPRGLENQEFSWVVGVREGPDEGFSGLVGVAQAVVLAALQHPGDAWRQELEELLADVHHRVAEDAAEVARGVFEDIRSGGVQPGGERLTELDGVERARWGEVGDVDLDSCGSSESSPAPFGAPGSGSVPSTAIIGAPPRRAR